MNCFTRNKKGFTLIELLVAISIIAILSAVGFSTFNQAQVRARDARRKSDLRSIATALEIFYQKNGRYPCGGANWQYSGGTNWIVDLNSVASGCTGDGANISPTYINNIPKDPSSNTTAVPSAGCCNYFYWSNTNTFSGAGSTCLVAGQYYILVAYLENANDSERLGSNSLTYCGNQTIDTNGGYRANDFIIAKP